MVRPRKALGQHFLSDPRLLAKIAAATGASPGTVVLEIGPGRGGLTAALLERGATVVAIERDVRLQRELEERFAGRPFRLVMGDALELDWRALIAPGMAAGAQWHVAGNIPYNITTPLLAKALSDPLPASTTFLVQRELAERVVAEPGSRARGALSVGLQAVADVTRLFAVGRGAFHPPPKVDSAVIRLVPLAAPLVDADEIAAFRRFVTGVFSYRRKRIGNAIRQATGITADAAAALLRESTVDAALRPESLTVADFVTLFRTAALHQQ